MIIEILYSYLLPTELGSIAVKIVDFIKKANLDIPCMIQMTQMVSNDIMELNNALSREDTNEFTLVVKLKDDQRNNAFIVIRDMTKANLKRTSAVIVDAAKMIMDTIKKYGSNINKQSGTEKSYTLSLLLDELADPVRSKAIQTLGLTEHLEDLKKACAEHTAAYHSKLETEGKKDGIPLKEAREILTRHLANLLGTIENLDECYPGSYKQLVSMINEAVADLMWLVKSRKTRDKNSDLEEEKKNTGAEIAPAAVIKKDAAGEEIEN